MTKARGCISALFLSLATTTGHTTAAQSADLPWRPAIPSQLTNVGRLTNPKLFEASGAAESRANKGVIWTIGDSGNPPELYAIDSTGTLLATFPLAAAKNVDWEAVAVGPCGSQTCVYIADTGDNSENRKEVSILRVTEPKLLLDGRIAGALKATVLRFRYPDSPHDVEALGITPAGDVLLVTKGRSSGVLAFELSAGQWRQPQLVEARSLGKLPIQARRSTGDLVTGLALDRTGRHLAIRTYRTVYLFSRAPSGSLRPDGPTSCSVLGAEPQGEGITWLEDGRLLLISEKGMFPHGTVTTLSCLPRIATTNK